MFYIEDGFYADPMNVREVALSMDFNITGNYPGLRTKACEGEYFTNIKKSFENRNSKPFIIQYNCKFFICRIRPASNRKSFFKEPEPTH